MGKKKEFNTWVLMHLSKREMFIALLIFLLSSLFFRFLGKLIWRKRKMEPRANVTVIRSKINELTIDEFKDDLKGLSNMMDGLNNDFLSGDKTLMESTSRFRNINKIYLELKLRFNHITFEIEKGKFKYDEKKIKDLEDELVKIKDSLDLLSEELQRETDEAQSYTLSMLTLIETIFLPLGVLTGYFGMNFSSMGGHVGKGHEPAPGLLGIKYGQTFVWGIMAVCTAIILYSFDWSKMEHFSNIKELSDSFGRSIEKRKKLEIDEWSDAMENQTEVRPFNVTAQDLKKLRSELLPPMEYHWSKSMEPIDVPKCNKGKVPKPGSNGLMDFPIKDINFYK